MNNTHPVQSPSQVPHIPRGHHTTDLTFVLGVLERLGTQLPKDDDLAAATNGVRYLLSRMNDSTQSAHTSLPDPTTAVIDVLAERNRQIVAEGRSHADDDECTEGEIALGAACYAMSSAGYAKGKVPPIWPWSLDWWKPVNSRRDLVRAGALILAEIERLDRSTLCTVPQEDSRHTSP